MTALNSAIEMPLRRATGQPAVSARVLAFALLAPLPAEANSGIGLFGLVWPLAFLFLLPAILGEGLVVWRIWKVGFLRALWWMTLANLVSTVAGALVGFSAEIATYHVSLPVTAGGMVGALLPLFVISWLIEWAGIRNKRPKDSAASPRKVALVANAVSYALIVAALFAFPRLREPPMIERTMVFEALTEMYAAKSEVADYFQAMRGLPEPMPLSANPHGRLRSLKIEGEGRLVGELRMPGRAQLDGKLLVLAPRLQEGRIAEWTCRAPDVPDKYLPASCRRGPTAPSRP